MLIFCLSCEIKNFTNRKPDSIVVELLGNKTYAERPIHINRNSVKNDSIVKDSIYIPPLIVSIEDSVFEKYLNCFSFIFSNIDTIKKDYRGLSIIFLHNSKIIETKSFYGQSNVDSIINKLEACGIAKYDSIGADVISAIKKNRNFYYKD